MLSVIPPKPKHEAERGMTYLQSEAWLPPACDPARVMAEIHGRRYEACRGFSSAGGPIWSNVVERLAVAYALLRAHGESPQKPLIMWEMLESIGHEVTPEFAELGSDAALLMEILDELLADQPVGVLRIDLAHRALGRLWSAAFSAPPGFEQHVARSASGAEPAELSFFHSMPPPGSKGGKALGRHLLALVDLLQAAVAMRDLPDTRVGLPIEIESWTHRIAYLEVGRGGGRGRPLEIHTKREEVGQFAHRITLKLVDGISNEVAGVGSAVLLSGKTGMYDELVECAEEVGGTTAKQVAAVFGPSDVVTIYPRVRRLLDACENRLKRLLVVDHLFVAKGWRGRSLGKSLLRQLLVESGDVDVVLGHPAAIEPRSEFLGLPRGVQAGYAAARLRLARYWSEVGGEYLIHGVMGIPLHEIQNERLRGVRERLSD